MESADLEWYIKDVDAPGGRRAHRLQTVVSMVMYFSPGAIETVTDPYIVSLILPHFPCTG